MSSGSPLGPPSACFTACTRLFAIRLSAGPDEGEAVDDAAEWADLADISAMLLVRLNAVHSALDSTELVRAKVESDMVQLTEMARELVSSDEREVS
jgi:hypothetical protein